MSLKYSHCKIIKGNFLCSRDLKTQDDDCTEWRTKTLRKQSLARVGRDLIGPPASRREWHGTPPLRPLSSLLGTLVHML